MNLENKKQFATIFLAVGLGLVAAFLTSQYVKNSIETQTKQLAAEYGKKNKVLAAEMEKNYSALKGRMDKQKADLERKLKAEVQRQRAASAATSSGDNKDAGVVQPVVQMSAFSVRTPAGKRAVTINIDSLSAVGGLINPGDFVDVMAKLNIPKEIDKKSSKSVVTTVLFQNIQVLAVGTNYKPLGAEPAYAQQQKARALNVTLAVTPEEAGLLSFAQSNGKLQLTLRSPAEQDTISIQTASWSALSDFVMEKQGTQLNVPSKSPRRRKSLELQPEEVEIIPFVEIYKGGKGTN